MKPAVNMAWVKIRKGQASQAIQVYGERLFQPVAVRVKGRAEIPSAPIIKARSSHLLGSDDRNNAPPERIKPQPQAVAPTELARRAAATANEPIPINQNGRAVNSSGARSHAHPP